MKAPTCWLRWVRIDAKILWSIAERFYWDGQDELIWVLYRSTSTDPWHDFGRDRSISGRGRLFFVVVLRPPLA